MSRGTTSWVPRVIEQTGWSLDVIPIRLATSTTASGPTVVTSWAKIVLTEWAVASARLMVPPDSSA